MNWQQVLDIVAKKEHRSVDGKISCSSLPVLKLCGGSLKAQRKVKKISKKFDQEGSALHYCMEHNIMPDDVSEENREKIEKALRVIEYLKGEGWEIWQVEHFLETKYFCGTPDIIFKNGIKFLILDFKFGWQNVSDDSYQMLGYADLICEIYEQPVVYSCIVQPERDEVNILQHFFKDVSDMVVEIKQNEIVGIRTPSKDACQFCAACGTFACPETQEMSHELAKPEFKGEISVQNLTKYAHLLPIMKKAVTGFEDQLKEHLKTNKMENVWLKEGYTKYTVESVVQACLKLNDKIHPSEIVAKTSITLKSIENLLYENKLCKKKDARAMALELLGDTVTSKKTADQLKFN